MYTLFFGTFIQLSRTPADEKHALSIHRGALWVSSTDGRVRGYDWDVRNDDDLVSLIRKNGWVVVDDDDHDENVPNGFGSHEKEKVKVIKAREDRNEFFFPGFIDTHIHASQYPNSGIFGSSTLLDWLETYTFPLESSYRQNDSNVAPPKAHTAYNQVISRTLSHGTTCASYFATVHVPATNLLARLCHTRGQRAFIGRVCMDNPSFCPEYYMDASAEESVTATESTIAYIHSLDPKGVLVKPIVTPRFAPTCSAAALSGLGKLAAAHDPPLHIQTHISENTSEVQLVQDLFPDSTSYADVYDRAGLLTPRTILAHGVHLTRDERALIRARNAKVAHCPASNSALGSGICPVRTLLDDGITVGLGTDVSGGYSASILEAVRQACLVSRLLGHTLSSNDPTGHEKITVEEGLYLATRGGAAVVDMADEIGGFETGMFFDAQLIELGAARDGEAGEDDDDDEPVGNVDVFGWENWSEKIHKWVWMGDDRNVKAVWVNGRLVHSRKERW